ncbi:MAG: molybdopterin converting factor subunit 1 [Methanomicrobia archaeon]|nr:molybdopterin converting factor subunit 1 [Methanomicrobia archaeon]
MKVEVRFFARCREIVGEKQRAVELEDGMTLKDFKDLLMREYPALKRLTLLISLNHAYADPEAKLKDQDEIAVFPPVSGG